MSSQMEKTVEVASVETHGAPQAYNHKQQIMALETGDFVTYEYSGSSR